MKGFDGRLAVITGGGTGMGRELARQLAAEGCHIALCDVSEENMAHTRSLCAARVPTGCASAPSWPTSPTRRRSLPSALPS